MVDEFDFGLETVTIQVAGRYRLEVQTLQPVIGAPLSFSMSRKALPLQLADVFRTAEIEATRSKLSGKLSDIDESLRLWKIVKGPSSIARTHLKRGFALLNASNVSAAHLSYEESRSMCRS